MRRSLAALPLLLVTLNGLAAQSAPRRWGIDFLLSRDAFTGASTALGGSVEISPNPRLAYEVGVSRIGAHWGLRLGLGVATGGLRGKTGPVLVDDNSTAVDRYRATLELERVIARADRLQLGAVVGPTLDRWESEGLGNRTNVGARAGLRLGILLGRLSLEEVAMAGLSSSSFNEADVSPTGKIEPLWTWSIGAGVRLGL